MRKKISSYLGIILFFAILPLFSEAQSLTILSWNIRDFGKTKDATEINRIAKIMRDYDVVAIQEVVAGYGGSQAVVRLADELNQLGSKWDYRISPPTKSPSRKTERYAFLWKPSKIKLNGRPFLASDYAEKIFREPYLAPFEYQGKSLMLINYHARRYDEKPEEEAAFLHEFYMEYFNEVVLFLGDFNLPEDHRVFNALEFLGYKSAIENQKTTLKRRCDNYGKYLNYNIDNIFYPSDKIKVINAGIHDFVRGCEFLKEDRGISDHLGVFLKFGVN
jgi:endonuclease/exonuclease/phosphatase family metal-dependent hydrolase